MKIQIQKSSNRFFHARARFTKFFQLKPKLSTALRPLSFICLLCGLSVPLTELKAQSARILEESEVRFEVSNMRFNTVRGSISGFEGELRFDPKRPEEAHFDVSVDVSTLKSGIGKRDRHLMEEEFFHREKYPRIRMLSDMIELGAAEGRYVFHGKLIIKDKEQELIFSFDANQKADKTELSGRFSVQRLDFDLGRDHSSFTIGEEVEVILRVMVSAEG